jgi:hypothetical protein
VWPQVVQRSGGRTGDKVGREALQRAGGEQQPDSVREQEQSARDGACGQPGQQQGPAACVIR